MTLFRPCPSGSQSTKLFKRTQKYSPLFLEFLEDAKEASPKLFSEDVHASTESSYDLLGDLQGVFRAWNALKRLRRSKNRKISEAEYAGNVCVLDLPKLKINTSFIVLLLGRYEIIRSIALTRSEYRYVFIDFLSRAISLHSSVAG